MPDREWEELGRYTVTDPVMKESTTVILSEEVDADLAPEYRLEVKQTLEDGEREQTLLIPADAMPELHWLIAQAAGDWLDHQPSVPGKCEWSRSGGFRCHEDATAFWTRDGWKNSDGTDRGHEETRTCETHKMGERYGWVRHPLPDGD